MIHRLCTAAEAAQLIESGKALMLAGCPEVLGSLPNGTWVGGTIPYFMSEEGGLRDTTRVFVTELPAEAGKCSFKAYTKETMPKVVSDGPEGSITFLILPGFSEALQTFANGAPEYEGMYMRPLAGWVAGVSVEDMGKVAPKTYLGTTGESFEDAGVAVHVKLPAGVTAHIDIVNLFKPDVSTLVGFSETGFTVEDCVINGEKVNLARHITENKLDVRLPLVSDMCGAIINTGIAAVDVEAGKVSFYAPVFPGLEYHFAAAIGEYAEEFEKGMPDKVPGFACNCILNYLYGGLEGKRLRNGFGPMTFGEIAYQLLNQTMVYVTYTHEA